MPLEGLVLFAVLMMPDDVRNEFRETFDDENSARPQNEVVEEKEEERTRAEEQPNREPEASPATGDEDNESVGSILYSLAFKRPRGWV